MSLNILFLDDEPELCDLFKDFFSSEHINVNVFSDPSEALDFAQKNDLDLIFVDYRLPGTNGDQVALKMPSKVPKILLTGEMSVETTYRFEAVMEKPVDMAMVEARIQTALQAKQKSSA